MGWQVGGQTNQTLNHAPKWRRGASYVSRLTTTLPTTGIAWRITTSTVLTRYLEDEVEFRMNVQHLRNTLGVMRYDGGIALESLADPELLRILSPAHPQYGQYTFAYVLAANETTFFVREGVSLTSVSAVFALQVDSDTHQHRNNVIQVPVSRGTVYSISAGGVQFGAAASLDALAPNQYVVLGTTAYIHLGNAALFPKQLSVQLLTSETLVPGIMGRAVLTRPGQIDTTAGIVTLANSVHTPNASLYYFTHHRTFVTWLTSRRVLVAELNIDFPLTVFVPPAAPNGDHIRTSKVSREHLQPFAAMPILSGVFQMSMALENFPSASLQLNNIHPKDLAAYKDHYCRINKEFNFYGVPFMVYSYSENLESDVVNGQYITRHSVSIQFRSKWELLGGRTLLLSRINNSLEAYLRKRVTLAELGDALGVPYRGPNILVRLPSANELTGEVFVSFNNQLQSYVRLNGCYSDYTQADAVYARPLLWGNSYTLSSWDVVYNFPIQQNTPFVFRRANAGTLYETFDYDDADDGLLAAPRYVRNIGPTVTFTTGDLSGAELFQDIGNKSPFITGDQAGPTLTFKDTTVNSGITVREAQDIFSFVFTLRSADVNWTQWKPINVSWTNYNYAPLSVTTSNAQVRTRTGELVSVFLLSPEILTSSGQVYAEQSTSQTALPALNLQSQILTQIVTRTNSYVRYISESHALGRDLQVIDNLIQEKQSTLVKMSWASSSTSNNIQLKRIAYQRALVEVEIDVLLAKRALMEYTLESTSRTGVVISKRYPEPANKSLPFAVSRVRPAQFAESIAAQMDVDSQGFAYIGWIVPGWLPPMYVAEEIRESGGASLPRDNPEQLLVNFQRTTERNYLEDRLVNEFKVSLGQPFGADPVKVPPDNDVIEIVKRLDEIKALEDRPKLYTGAYSSYRVKRTVRNQNRTVLDPRTGQQKQEPFEMYNEFVREVTYRGPDARTAILNTRTADNPGRPPSPTVITPNYVLLNQNLKLPPRYLWYVRSKDYDLFRYVGDIDATQQDGENLASFPTTSFEKTQVGIETDLSLRHMQDYRTSNLTLFGFHEYFRPGDYVHVTDIPELQPRPEEGVLRVTAISLQITFEGIDPLGDIAAQCPSTNIAVGCFRKREIEVVEKILAPTEGVTNDDIVGGNFTVTYPALPPTYNPRP